MTLTFGSLFAGVGGFDLGLERAGMTPVWQVEWDRHASAVLAHHWPTVERHTDVRTVTGLPPVDCITYGFPCTDLSVAGKRAGLDGDRSGLFFEAIRIIREMRDATNGTHPTWAVAENVPGLLSADNGTAMGRCLDELADAGAVVVEWAVLDARWFGVPQRRRRVFIVACFDPATAARCPDPLLPVGPRGVRHPGSGDEAGQVVAALTSTGVGTCGADDNQAQAGHLVPVPFVKVVRSGARDADGELPAEVWRDEATAPTLNAFDNGHESRATVLAVAKCPRCGGVGKLRLDDTTCPLCEGSGERLPRLRAVRRLTPVECERLQGFPDDWTAGHADSHRYRFMGNAVAVPVAEWVARQISRACPQPGSVESAEGVGQPAPSAAGVTT